jgi:hypothetical protein
MRGRICLPISTAEEANTMAALLLGVAIWVVFAAAAWRYSTYHPTLHPFDRMGAAAFFLVVGLPFVGAGLALIAHPLVAT